jgi:hypothetical protein
MPQLAFLVIQPQAKCCMSPVTTRDSASVHSRPGSVGLDDSEGATLGPEGVSIRDEYIYTMSWQCIGTCPHQSCQRLPEYRVRLQVCDYLP